MGIHRVPEDAISGIFIVDWTNGETTMPEDKEKEARESYETSYPRHRGARKMSKDNNTPQEQGAQGEALPQSLD